MSKTLNKRNDKQPYSEICRQDEIQCDCRRESKKFLKFVLGKDIRKVAFYHWKETDFRNISIITRKIKPKTMIIHGMDKSEHKPQKR